MKKKIIKAICCIISANLMFSGCASSISKSQSKENITTSSAKASENKNENEIDENTGLKIISSEKFDYTKTLKVKNLEGGYRLVEILKEKLLIIPEGKEKPQNLKKEVETVKLPVKKVIPASTADLAFLTTLGCAKDIVAQTKKIEEMELEEIKEAMKAGKIEFIGEAKAMNYERIVQLNPDFVYNSPTGISYYSQVTEKLTELGIPKISVAQYRESDPRARIEWMKFFGIMHGKEKEAKEWFDKEAAKITESEKKNEKKTDRKKILYFRISPKGITVKKDGDYSVKMTELAGGLNPLKDIIKGEDGTQTISPEEFYSMAQDTDILIHENMGTIIDSYKKMTEAFPILADLKAFKDRKVWTTSKDYWMKTDRLADMILELDKIMNSEEAKDYEYYKMVR